nr:hypothetical protein [Candidatus Njordarchaeota archaeon]
MTARALVLLFLTFVIAFSVSAQPARAVGSSDPHYHYDPVIAAGGYWYWNGTYNAGSGIYGSFAQDGFNFEICFFILDAGNFTKFQANPSDPSVITYIGQGVGLGKQTWYSGSFAFPVPYTDNWYIVLSNVQSIPNELCHIDIYQDLSGPLLEVFGRVAFSTPPPTSIEAGQTLTFTVTDLEDVFLNQSLEGITVTDPHGNIAPFSCSWYLSGTFQQMTGWIFTVNCSIPSNSIAGYYKFVITAEDGVGNPSTISLTVYVYAEPTINQPPNPTFTAGTKGNTVTWQASSELPSNYSVSYWAGGKECYYPNHTWTGGNITQNIDSVVSCGAGTYSVTCTVYDSNGYSASSTIIVKVIVPSAPTINQPTAITYTVNQTGNSITWNPSSQIPDHYTISVKGGCGAYYTHVWNGSMIIYNVDGWSAGTYVVNCTVYDTLGRNATSKVTVTVTSRAHAPTIDRPSAITYTVGSTGNNIVWHPSSQIPDNYTISVNGSSPISYSWDGSTITYNVDGWSVGTYTVNCTVYDTQGGSATSTVTVRVQQSPIVAVGLPIALIGGVAIVVVVVALGWSRSKKK